MRKAEWIALFISLAGVAAAFLVAVRVFEAVPHVEDEMAYVWQAKVLLHGQMAVPTPPEPAGMTVPFVVNTLGHRSAKYPPGWPMLLALGIGLGVRTWVNPLLGGLAVWLTFRIGQKMINSLAGLLAALLMAVSPFFLMLSGSLDSNAWSLVLSIIFCIAWLDTFHLGHDAETASVRPVPPWLTIALAGLSLGCLIITRPLTALGVAIPFFIHGLLLLWRGDGSARRHVLTIGAIALLVGALFPAWQYVVTGNPLIDPYTLWWSFDRIGFGPGIGLAAGGHTVRLGLENARLMLAQLWKDLFGWVNFSWLFLPYGLWALRKNRVAWLIFCVFISLVICYVFYWAPVIRYGPRYYYEGIFGLALVSAAGMLWLAGLLRRSDWHGLRVGLVGATVVCLIGYNLAVYLPARFKEIYGLYGVHAAQLAPFKTAQAQALTPALVIVHTQKSWTEYAGLLELEDPWLTSPFIFAWSSNSSISDATLAAQYPGRKTIYYYADQPGKFYFSPR